MTEIADTAEFLASVHPYDSFNAQERQALAARITRTRIPAGSDIYAYGAPLEGLYLVREGLVEILGETGEVISHLGPRNSFGERGLMRNGLAASSARAETPVEVLIIPVKEFTRLRQSAPAFQRFFERGRPTRGPRADLSTSRVDALMARTPISCPPETTVQQAARLMRDHHVSCLCVTVGDDLAGIVTLRDLSGRVVADARPPETPVSEVMSTDIVTLSPDAIGSDVLHLMMERRVGHVPICEAGRLTGIVTQTDLTRYQALNSAELVRGIASAPDATVMARSTAQIPSLLAQLFATGLRHDVITRLITDVADTATRKLLALAEARLGPPPLPYLWLACGSQGRQEQTGVSDQDNCLFLADGVSDADRDGYFAELAQFVCDGLDTCGYVYCPGDMMATNPRWRQPVSVWRDYFDGWITRPDPEAQMLASVMFDLRPIGGATALFGDLQDETLRKAARNSIFVAHMVANSLKHTPPLSLFRGFATIRSGVHRNHIDMKHSGVVPVTDLARVYALQGQLKPANTRARIEAGIAAGVVSASGGQSLLDAYDLIAESRLAHQARRVAASQAPDNYLSPAELSDFDRSHLRDAFVVVKSMQSAIGHGRGALS
ncbi:CBS domain-containing protein [Poseidonocella pacifica]|uniref:CBS domain-containing protein n=1 Tax=Poseidonocella pacifica TaxID=871651 RepID=A0A1I0VU05_9RHOB|nr:DUF294 nucleotidyltransferase-like domain-containing protein [Poseidonocella pacifica]SFA79824.1 CBS domain-containing protein [Poseidonocella pacifica]